MQNSPNGRKIWSTCRWRRVSIVVINIYVLLNVPVAVPSQKFVFGQVECRDERMARELEEKAGDGEGDRNGGNGDVDGTTSGSSVNSIRVEASRLATKSHHIRYSRRTQDQDLPVSPGPPTYYAERPNGLVKRRHRRNHIKIEPTKINSAQNGKKAHLGCAHAAQPCGNSQKCSYGVVEPKRRRRRIKFEPTNVNRALKIWNAYQGLYNPRQPLPLNLGDRTRSTLIRGLLYSHQSLNNSLQNVSRDNNKSIASHRSANASTTAQRIHRGHVTYQIG